MQNENATRLRKRYKKRASNVALALMTPTSDLRYKKSIMKSHTAHPDDLARREKNSDCLSYSFILSAVVLPAL
jgi:hypothetical protein